MVNCEWLMNPLESQTTLTIHNSPFTIHHYFIFLCKEHHKQMAYQKIVIPQQGEKIRLEQGKLVVPDNPIIAYIEGDGTGVDIWAASQPVLDAAVSKAYGGKRQIVWME